MALQHCLWLVRVCSFCQSKFHHLDCFTFVSATVVMLLEPLIIELPLQSNHSEKKVQIPFFWSPWYLSCRCESVKRRSTNCRNVLGRRVASRRFGSFYDISRKLPLVTIFLQHRSRLDLDLDFAFHLSGDKRTQINSFKFLLVLSTGVAQVVGYGLERPGFESNCRTNPFIEKRK